MKAVLRMASFASIVSLLAACNQTSSPAPAPSVAASTVTPSTFRMPEGSGCNGEVARYRAVMDNDLQMGHVNQSVYSKVVKEIDSAAASCASGNDAGSVASINATKRRYGYL